MKDFEFYDIAGLVAPGMIVVVGGIILFWPDQQSKLAQIANLSMGGLGVGLLLAYVAGQLLQTVGNAVESIWWWFWGGMPTDWVRSGKHMLVAEAQRDQLQGRVRRLLKNDQFELSISLPHIQWYSVTRQIYAVIAAAGRSARVDKFNGIYGLCRGIAAAFLVLLLGMSIVDWRAWKLELILLGLTGTALYRMHRFAKIYGREMFVQFIQAPEEPGKL